MPFPPLALERAMQIKEVLLRAMRKECSWRRAPRPRHGNGRFASSGSLRRRVGDCRFAVVESSCSGEEAKG